MKYDEPLDPEQVNAVEAEDRAIAVLAGPGSGKTRVLSYRARHLLAKDKKAGCLLLTFTNKAASEMKARAIKANPVMSKRIQAGTFHNFSLGVLKSHGSLVGLAQDFDVIDENERAEYTARAAALAKTRDLYREWSGQRLRLQLPTAEVAKFGAAYDAEKRKANVVDFDDLVVFTGRLFREQPEVASAYAAKFQHTLIDEFQDTNAAQFAIVRSLAEHASPESTIGVFADDDQAIFGFAGAEARNIERFCNDLNATTYPLTTNYRCANAVVSVANKLIEANRAKGRQMKPHKRGGEVSLRVFASVDEEAVAICAEIREAIKKGKSPDSISILVRNQGRATALASALVAAKIPFSNWMAAGYNTRETRQVRVCLAAVRPTMNNRACRHICEMLGVEGKLPAVTTPTKDFLEGLNGDAAAHLLEVRQLADSGAKVSAIMAKVAATIKVIDPENSNVDSLVHEARAFEEHDPEYSLEHFLADLALGGKGGAPTVGGGVKLATIHRTKGLQWPHVYLVGLEEDNLPSFQSATTEEGVREERRLCFVGVCRAEDSLTLTRVQSHRGFVKYPSRFLAEMGFQ